MTTSPNDDFGESWPLLDSVLWEPRSPVVPSPAEFADLQQARSQSPHRRPASSTTMLSTMHWVTKARVWRKVKAKVSNGSQRKQSVRRLVRRLAPHETCPATPMTLWEFYYPMRLDMMRRTSPNDDFDESWPLLDSVSWEPRSLGY